MNRNRNPLNTFQTRCNSRRHACSSNNDPCDNALTYAAYRDNSEWDEYDADKCLKRLMCYQARVSKCEAKLFCEASSRLSYELYRACSPCEVKKIMGCIGSLFTTSAKKEKAMADILKSYAYLTKKYPHPVCCCKSH